MILRNPHWAAELASAGREHVREHHSWDNDAQALVALFERDIPASHGGNQVSPVRPPLKN